MNLERFVAERSAGWRELEGLVAAAGGKPEKLGPQGVQRLGSLYRGASADLALARRKWPRDPVERKLESLVRVSRQLVYDSEPRRRSFADFFLRTYWQRVVERPGMLLISGLLLVVPFVGAVTWALVDEASAARFVPDVYHAATAEGRDGDLGISVSEQAAFSSFIFTNNVRVSFLAFGAGILLGIGTGYVLVFNGLLLGAASGLFAGGGNGLRFLELVAAHGVLELTCIVVAGAAGLRIGWALIEPGDKRRVDSLVAESRRAVEIVLGTAPWLVLAGLVEGFITPNALGPSGATVLGVALGAVYWTLVVRRGRTRLTDEIAT